jgi:hypothetical protein
MRERGASRFVSQKAQSHCFSCMVFCHCDSSNLALPCMSLSTPPQRCRPHLFLHPSSHNIKTEVTTSHRIFVSLCSSFTHSPRYSFYIRPDIRRSCHVFLRSLVRTSTLVLGRIAMRLLQAATIKLKRFEMINIPPYAILSHTWGSDEVTFQDMEKPNVVNKAGYLKIKYSCEEAMRRDLEYVWVDTCCIDKSSSAELSEAINSMFKWYEDAVECFAYLGDMYHFFDEMNSGVVDGLREAGRYKNCWLHRI